MSARRRLAPRAEATSDVARGRTAWLASAVAGAAAIAALAIGPDARSPGPIARPHAEAGLACATCHDSGDARAKCARCHAGHASSRGAHRALAARGELACVGCHAPHASEGVTFAAAGRAIVWGPSGEREVAPSLVGPRGATVPLVRASACVGCHATDDARDPAARCVDRGLVVCFDEHRARDDRYVAWEAARAIAPREAPVARASSAPWGWSGAALAVGAIAFAVAARRGRGAAASASASASASATMSARTRLPVIDSATCLGCSACVDACPFDVLAIERFVAVVARPSECCGVVHCEGACPNGSLRALGVGAPIERPRVDAHLESRDVPGLFVAGDLTGVPLIRNAIEQGARVADRVASARARHADLDLLVVGAGPAGLSALIRAKERGLRAAALEQSTFAASLRGFPRGKVVFDVPGLPPLDGPLWMREATKEELVAHWTRAVRAHALDVREHRRVVDVTRDASGFVAIAARDDGAREEHRAARVLLALGRRGTPRALAIDVALGAEGKVSHALADARSFAGARVLVVGLGDSAMEAAIALARAGAAVTVSYRGATFTRGKERNVAELRALADRGRVAIVFASRLVAVGPGTATLDVADGASARSGGRSTPGTERRIVANDAVLALIGGAPSWDLVTRAGVKLAAE